RMRFTKLTTGMAPVIAVMMLRGAEKAAVVYSSFEYVPLPPNAPAMAWLIKITIAEMSTDNKPTTGTQIRPQIRLVPVILAGLRPCTEVLKPCTAGLGKMRLAITPISDEMAAAINIQV